VAAFQMRSAWSTGWTRGSVAPSTAGTCSPVPLPPPTGGRGREEILEQLVGDGLPAVLGEESGDGPLRQQVAPRRKILTRRETSTETLSEPACDYSPRTIGTRCVTSQRVLNGTLSSAATDPRKGGLLMRGICRDFEDE
jgi:hypothetical protein